MAVRIYGAHDASFASAALATVASETVASETVASETVANETVAVTPSKARKARKPATPVVKAARKPVAPKLKPTGRMIFCIPQKMHLTTTMRRNILSALARIPLSIVSNVPMDESTPLESRYVHVTARGLKLTGTQFHGEIIAIFPVESRAQFDNFLTLPMIDLTSTSGKKPLTLHSEYHMCSLTEERA